MSPPSSNALEASGLGKRYMLHRPRRTETLVSQLAGGVRAALRRARKPAAPGDFWALRDVGFVIGAGETVGIIGQNGAGKSTLLKILSRVTMPTTGSFTLRGRVASLLEIGTGFHPDLTCRQNIFLNGAILGMRQREIAAGFDEIVDFAAIEAFVDEPVKHLSSGMYMRLAFSVAVFLRSEILIVDEVLAVGDAEFQHKCVEHIRSAARSGRTILFVSHNLALVSQLTQRTLVLREGRVAFDGPTMTAVQHHLMARRHDTLRARRPTAQLPMARRYRAGDNLVIREVGFAAGQEPEIAPGGTVALELLVEARGSYDGLRLLYTLNDALGQAVLTGVTPPFTLRSGTQLLTLTMADLRLAPGHYDFTVSLGKGGLAEGKIEYDALGGFGGLTVAEDRGVGYWRTEWGAVIHDRADVAVRDVT